MTHTQHTALRCPACGSERIQTGEMIVIVPLRLMHDVGLCLHCDQWMIHDGRAENAPQIVTWAELQRMRVEGVLYG